MKNIIITSILALFLFSCNKEKRFSKKLIKGENWEVSSIKVDGENIPETGTWTVFGDDIYETVSEIRWQNNTLKSNFQWQFQEKGKKWVLNNLCDCENKAEGAALNNLDYYADSLAGSYDVIKHKRKEMVFESTITKHYTNKKVEITLKRVD
jgi:hypothetical protein